MSSEKIVISEAELEIMKVLWDSKEPVTSLDIGKAVEAHGWKKTTIATFLARLCEKGAINAEKQGKLYYYTPAIDAEEYKRSRTESLIASLYHGSVKELASALFKSSALSKEDIEELHSMFDDSKD